MRQVLTEFKNLTASLPMSHKNSDKNHRGAVPRPGQVTAGSTILACARDPTTNQPTTSTLDAIRWPSRNHHQHLTQQGAQTSTLDAIMAGETPSTLDGFTPFSENWAALMTRCPARRGTWTPCQSRNWATGHPSRVTGREVEKFKGVSVKVLKTACIYNYVTA